MVKKPRDYKAEYQRFKELEAQRKANRDALVERCRQLMRDSPNPAETQGEGGE